MQMADLGDRPLRTGAHNRVDDDLGIAQALLRLYPAQSGRRVVDDREMGVGAPADDA